MDVQALFLQRVQLIRDGPILYKGDPDVPAMVSAELSEFVGLGIPDDLLQATIDTFLVVSKDAASQFKDEYDIAYKQLVADIQENVLYKSYLASPSVTGMKRLLEYYKPIAPAHTVLLAGKLKQLDQLLFGTQLNLVPDQDLQALVPIIKTLNEIGREEPNVQTAVEKVQRIILDIDNIPCRMAIVIGFTPENFSFETGFHHRYEFDNVLTAQIFQGFNRYFQGDYSTHDYMVWWMTVFRYLESTKSPYGNILMSVFPPPASETLSGTIPEELIDVITLAGEAFAALCTVYTTDTMRELILTRLAHMYIDGLAPHSTPLDMPFKNWAWSVLPSVSETAQTFFERVGNWIHVTKRLANQWASPATILSPLFALFYTTSLALYEFIDKLLEVFIYGVDKFATPFITWLKEYLYLGRAWSSVVLPGARRRPKSVWALLFVHDFMRLDPGTKYALSLKPMSAPPPMSYTQWEEGFLESINKTGLGDFELFPTTPLRQLRLPYNPITIDEEVLKLAPLFGGRSRPTDIMAEKLLKWREYNVPQGIDGQWFATPERVAQSIRRYDVDRIEPTDEITSLVRETAHALADKYPEMYKYYNYFTPQHAMRRLKWDTDMSPGLGFIGNVRSRRHLRKHGFLNAILDVAHKRLQSGIHPGTVAHCFVKEQVVSLEKLLRGKNIRTVVAMDLMSNTLALPFSIDLSRAPPPEAYVLNALPRSEGGYRPFFDDLRKHALTIQADAHEFDSKLGPVITVEGLAELRSIAFEENPALDIISSQIKAHYISMRFAKLVDLTTGRVFDKTGGMMTGQVNTSYDNRDSFRLMLIAAYSYVTGKPPHTFWDENVLGNAGDDDGWGTNLSYDQVLAIVQSCKDLFGVVVEIEQVGWENLSLTALQPTPEQPDTAFYRAQLGMPAVSYGIRTEPAKLLLTKTEFKMRHARLSDIPFRMAHVDSMIGTAYLSAYNPDIYNDLADLYVNDMKYILLRFCTSVTITEQRDAFGNITSVDIGLGNIRPRYQRHAQNISGMLRNWLKKVKWPAYQKVFNIWVRPYSKERSSIAKHHRLLVSAGPALPVATKLLYGLVGFRESLYAIPNHVVRALPEFPGADISMTLKTPEYIIERFVWASLFHKLKRVPTRSAFMNALREGPYAAAASPLDFLEFIEDIDNMKELVQTDLNQLRCLAISMTLIYSFLEKILQYLTNIPLFGLPITLYAISTRDINRVYALLNHIYWLAEGRSSSVISNLMPADPYAWMKQLSVILTSGIPSRWVNIPGVRHLVSWVPALVEAWTLATVTVQPNVGRVVFSRHLPLNSPWATVVDKFLILSTDLKPSSVCVVAPTGSGKSTLFLALLHYIMPMRKIWLLCPTKLARDNYRNEFLPISAVQKLERGLLIRQDAIIYVLTYGYFCQIINSVSDIDLILFDEIHLSLTELWVAWYLVPNNWRIGLTATPKYNIQPTMQHDVMYPGARRFTMTMTYVTQTFEQLWTLLSTTQAGVLHRALIICPTLQRVNFVRNTLARLSFASSELSSDNPEVPKSGIIVATSIADQAITIEPPPSIVIDLGEMLVVETTSILGNMFPQHNAKVVPVSQEVADQRAGRGGRASDSIGFGLIVGPRTAHAPPVRTPTTVYMNDTVVDLLLTRFQLRVPLDELHPVPGLLKFINVNYPVLQDHHIHNVFGALVAFLYLSAGADFSEFARDIYTFVLLNTLSDQLRIYSSQAEVYMPGCNLLHVKPELVNQLLRSGVLNVSLNSTPYPVAALMFIEGWLLPVGYAFDFLNQSLGKSFLPSNEPVILQRGILYSAWDEFLFSFPVEGVVTLGRCNIQLRELFDDLTKIPVVPRGVPAVILTVLARFKRLYIGKVRTFRALNFCLNGNPYSTKMFNINIVTTRTADILLNTLTLDLSDLAMSIHSFEVLVLLISVMMLDDSYAIIGPFRDLDSLLTSKRLQFNLIQGGYNNRESFVIVPTLARLVFLQAAQHLTLTGLGSLFNELKVGIIGTIEEYQSWLNHDIVRPHCYFQFRKLMIAGV